MIISIAIKNTKLKRNLLIILVIVFVLGIASALYTLIQFARGWG